MVKILQKKNIFLFGAMMRAHMRFKPEQKITEMVTLARVAVEEENPTATSSSITLLKGCKMGFFTDNPTGKRLGLRNTSRPTPYPLGGSTGVCLFCWHYAVVSVISILCFLASVVISRCRIEAVVCGKLENTCTEPILQNVLLSMIL